MNNIKYFQSTCVSKIRLSGEILFCKNGSSSSNAIFSNANWLSKKCDFQYQPRRYAGHSKWANIKHTKSLKDGQRAKDLMRISNMMRVAIKEGGSGDPKLNSRLAQVIEQAKYAKLPMASIEKVMQTSQPVKDAKNFIIPIKGPGGCILIVEANSPTPHKTKQEVNSVLRKHKGNLFNETVSYFYNQKGVIRCTGYNGKGASPEDLELAVDHGIEAGAEEVNFNDDIEHGKIFEFITEPEASSFFKVKQTLEKMNYQVAYSDVEYVATQKVELAENELIEAGNLCEKLEAHNDVVRVYDNIE